MATGSQQDQQQPQTEVPQAPEAPTPQSVVQPVEKGRETETPQE
jgi:hypothetical protein